MKDGTIEERDGTYVLRYERQLPHPVDRGHIHLDHLADALDGRPVDWPHWRDEHGATGEAYHERYAPLVPA